MIGTVLKTDDWELEIDNDGVVRLDGQFVCLASRGRDGSWLLPTRLLQVALREPQTRA